MAGPKDYIADIPKTDLLRVIVALSTELYALSDRMVALEAILAEAGIDLAALDAPADPAVYDPATKARRDAFVARVFGALGRGDAAPAP